jgi:hypothetical protein
MMTAIYAAVAVAILAALSFVSWAAISGYRRFRGKMLVTCPETNRPAGVSVDARGAALTGLTGDPVLRLTACTRWPERQGCGQECLAQIERSPEDCLVRTMLTDWYRTRSCALCGNDFRRVDSYDHKAVWWYDKKPALLSPDGRTVEWHEVAVEAVPEVLGTHRPMCWDCLVIDQLRRRHPELITVRPGGSRSGGDASRRETSEGW